MYVCVHVNVLGDDGPLKITIYHVTSLPSGMKALTTRLLLMYIPWRTRQQARRRCGDSIN